MTTNHHTRTVRPETDLVETAPVAADVPAHSLLRGLLLAGSYVTALVATFALTVGGALSLNDTLALSLGPQLFVWGLAVAGVALAPVVARRAVVATAAVLAVDPVGAADTVPVGPVASERPER